MRRPVHITFRNMGVSPVLEQEIRSRALGSRRSIRESSDAECY